MYHILLVTLDSGHCFEAKVTEKEFWGLEVKESIQILSTTKLVEA